jgi:C-terminal processing protease CtpA/Prc
MLSKRVAVLSLLFVVSATWSQELSKLDRGRAQDILHAVDDDVRKHYYDEKFHGLDWNAKVAEAKQKIDQAKSFNGAMSAVAAMLGALDDSHTFFIPPQHAIRHDYGWKYQMIGEHCFVTHVRPKSDAEVKGLKPGDEILSINGFTPDRDDIWTMQYVFSALRPQSSLHVTLQDPAGNRRELDVAAKLRETRHITSLSEQDGWSGLWDVIRGEEIDEHLNRARTSEFGDELVILKLPQFGDYSPVQVAEMVGKAHKHKTLIMDLRGNSGGYVEVLDRFVGNMFDKDVKISDRVGRKERKPEIAKPSRNPFTGKLIVLVDSQSAYAAELFARVMQIEKRGMVLGDRASGSVMESKHYNQKWGTDIFMYYGVSVTDADLVMTDGKSLEHVGVTPDEILVPAAKSLAANEDPILARAAELAGVKISPEAAGKLFPYEWPPEQ